LNSIAPGFNAVV